MKQCPKCGRYMIWYCKPWCGTWLTGWKCVCGYDSIYNVSHTWSRETNLKEVKE